MKVSQPYFETLVKYVRFVSCSETSMEMKVYDIYIYIYISHNAEYQEITQLEHHSIIYCNECKLQEFNELSEI